MMGLGAAAGMALGDPPADYASIAAVGLFVALMCVCIVVGHLLEENRWMNESITALFIVSPPPRRCSCDSVFPPRLLEFESCVSVFPPRLLEFEGD
jgi:hypothetical protein